MERAARLFGAAENLRETIGIAISSKDRVEIDEALIGIRASVGEVTFAAEWTKGQGMTWEDVVSLALEYQEIREQDQAG